MSRKTTISLEDVARAAGVSKMTVSRVMRGETGFSEATRDRVLAASKELNYLPNRIAATFGSASASTLVGLCVPRFTSALFGQVTASIQSNLARLGYQTMIGSHDQNPKDEELWLRSLAAWRPAGVLLIGTKHTPAALEILRNLAVPIIELWDLTTQPLDMAVGFSHQDCGLTMGRYFVKAGRQRIGYVGALAEADTMGQKRQSGFEIALAEAGLALAAIELLYDNPGFYAGYVGTEMLLARAPNLDSIYFHDDEMAIGGMAYLRQHGISVNDDIGVAGWGALEAASILSERLTTTHVPTEAIGKAAAEKLVGRIRGEAVSEVEVIPTRLVPGNTISPLQGSPNK